MKKNTLIYTNAYFHKYSPFYLTPVLGYFAKVRSAPTFPMDFRYFSIGRESIVNTNTNTNINIYNYSATRNNVVNEDDTYVTSHKLKPSKFMNRLLDSLNDPNHKILIFFLVA